VIQQIIATIPVIAGKYAKLFSQVATLAQTLSFLQAKQALSSLSTPPSPSSTTTLYQSCLSLSNVMAQDHTSLSISTPPLSIPTSPRSVHARGPTYSPVFIQTLPPMTSCSSSSDEETDTDYWKRIQDLDQDLKEKDDADMGHQIRNNGIVRKHPQQQARTWVRKNPPSCYQCHGLGHIKRNCCVGLDVQRMMYEEMYDHFEQQ